MRAYVTSADAPLRLEERPVPTPGPHEVLIQTRAVALNNADLTGSGDPHIAGYEFAGEVLEVGSEAPDSLHAARVMGITAGASPSSSSRTTVT